MYAAIFVLEIILLFALSFLVTRKMSSVFLKITKNRTATIYLISLIFLPGIIIHELAHYFCASFLFVHVGRINFLPKISEGETVTMGSVEVGNTDPIRRAIIGFAPVISGVALICAIAYLFYSRFSQTLFPPSSFLDLGILIALVYIVFVIGNTMFSSRKDVEGTVELLAVIMLFFFTLVLAGIRVDTGIINLVISQEELIKQFVIFLAPLVGIDMIFLIVGVLIKTD